MSRYMNGKIPDGNFSAMISAAKSGFENHENKDSEYIQCLVIETAGGGIFSYPIFSDSVEELIASQCSAAEETGRKGTVKRIVCLWEKGEVDIPSHCFMENLCRINKENRNAEILLNGGEGIYLTKKIAEVMG